MKTTLLLSIILLFSFINISIAQSDGDLDPSFDYDGMINLGFSDDASGFGAALQADQKIVISGWAFDGSTYNFALARLNTDGSLDTSFDLDGKLTTDYGGEEYGTCCAIQSIDQKIIIGGYYLSTTDYDFILARYNTDGSLDPTFGDAGILVTDLGGNDYCYSVAIQEDGQILAAGCSGSDLAIVRYNEDGSFDESFGSAGMVITTLGGDDDVINKILLQGDKIIAAGTYHDSWDTDFIIAKYNDDGSIDDTFGTSGVTRTDLGYGDIAYTAALQDDNKVVLGGYSGGMFALARYNTDGSLDSSFDTDGYVTHYLTGINDQGKTMQIQSDGKIVLAGGSNLGDFLLARFNTDGSQDLTFGTDGIVITDFEGNSSKGRALLIQDDGKLVLTGYASDGYDNNIGAARYFSGTEISVDEVNDEIYLYPNPTTNLININIPDVNIVNVLDITGKTMYTFHNTDVIDLSNLSNGIYLIEIITESKSYNKKVIKN